MEQFLGCMTSKQAKIFQAPVEALAWMEISGLIFISILEACLGCCTVTHSKQLPGFMVANCILSGTEVVVYICIADFLLRVCYNVFLTSFNVVLKSRVSTLLFLYTVMLLTCCQLFPFTATCSSSLFVYQFIYVPYILL